MRIASLDMGSNTTLMLVADIEDGRLTVVEDLSTVTRMGQEIANTGSLHPDALVRIEECLEAYSKRIESLAVDKIVAVATSAARDASNKQELFEITNRYGIPIDVISGAKEAEITFRGSTYDLDQSTGHLVLDIGGGSTEFVFRNQQNQVEGVSLDMGSVRLVDMFVTQHPVIEKEEQALRAFIRKQLSEELPDTMKSAKLEKLVAVAGTPTTLAAISQEVEFQERKIHGFQLSAEVVKFLNKKMLGMSVDQRKGLVGLPEKRADVIVAGTTILEEVLDFFDFKQALVSTKGVRYGLAFAKAEEL